MSTNGPSEAQIRLIRIVFVLFAATSFVLGAWMMFDPKSAWGSMGIDVGAEPFAAAIYGGAIMGEGAMFALGAIRPVRYIVFLQYLMVYKTLACLAGLLVLVRMEPTPMGGWFVLAGWAFAGITAAVVFPWKQWGNVEAWYGTQ